MAFALFYLVTPYFVEDKWCVSLTWLHTISAGVINLTQWELLMDFTDMHLRGGKWVWGYRDLTSNPTLVLKDKWRVETLTFSLLLCYDHFDYKDWRVFSRLFSKMHCCTCLGTLISITQRSCQFTTFFSPWVRQTSILWRPKSLYLTTFTVLSCRLTVTVWGKR